MKKITKGLLIISICILSSHAYSQTVAVKGGLNLSKLSPPIGPLNNGVYNANPGFHLGATFDIPLSGMFAIETGVFITTKGARSRSSELIVNSTIITSKSSINIFNAELPVSFKAIFGINDDLNIFASAGGYLGLGIGGESRYKYDIDGEAGGGSDRIRFDENNYNRFDYGLTFGAGVEFKSLILGASYDLGLADFYDSQFMNLQNRVLKFSVGYRFGGNN
jgi:hypothetical protein